MNTVLLLTVPPAGFVVAALLAPLSRRSLFVSKTFAFIGFSMLVILAALARSEIGTVVNGPTILGRRLQFGLTDLSWYFALMITGIAWLTVVFSFGALRAKGGYPLYYAWLFAKTFGMLGVILSRDLLAFFILWEIMSWTTYFLMQQGSEKARSAAAGYLVYAVLAGVVLFAGVVFLRQASGSFSFATIASTVAGFNLWALILAAILLLVPMLIEAAAYPAHWWLPPAYASTETGITAYLAAISTRIGIFGITLFLFTVLGVTAMERLSVGHHLNLQVILMVFGAFTMVVPTFTALFQQDAKRLIAWSAVGQGGYMLVGIATASSLGVAGGLFHVFNHMAYVALILFSIAAVEYRTGTTDLNSLGGLIKKQPVAYVGLLFGIIGLAGLPPMNGFVSKWLIYRALILGGYPFIALSAFIGTLGTILLVYKLIHNIFLGRLPQRYNDVKEVGFFMQAPIWILMVVVWGTGIFPGIILGWVARIQTSLGLVPLAYTLYGVAAQAGRLNMLVVNIVFIAAVGIGFLLFLAGGRRKRVVQNNNYAGGHFLDESVKYNFNFNFYSAFDHIFAKLVERPPIKRAERGLIALIERGSDYARRIYTGQLNTYLAYGVAVVILAVVVLKEVHP